MDNYSDPSKRRQMEYATQIFGYTPDSLVDTILGDVTEIVSVKYRAARRHVLNEFKEKGVEEKELEESFARIQERAVEGAEKVYFKLGCYLKDKILVVPEHVLLEEDSAAHADGPGVDGADLTAAKQRFDGLCKAAGEAKIRRAALLASKKNLETVLERQKKVLDRMRALREKSAVRPNLLYLVADAGPLKYCVFPSR